MAFEGVLEAIRVFQELLLLEVLQVLQECSKCYGRFSRVLHAVSETMQ